MRVILYEDAATRRAIFEYDLPSSLFGQFGDEPLAKVGQELDTELESACSLRAVPDSSDTQVGTAAQVPAALRHVFRHPIKRTLLHGSALVIPFASANPQQDLMPIRRCDSAEREGDPQSARALPSVSRDLRSARRAAGI